MSTTDRVFSAFKYLVLFFIFSTNAKSIRLYKNANFAGLLYNSNSTAACNNFPSNATLWIRSVRVDSCFIVYENLNCDPIHSKKITQDESLEEFLSVRSFHTCNENNGGSQLDIDIKTFQNNTSVISHVSQSYKDVCTCINVPKHVLKTDTWFIDNHGNELFAYFEQDCSSTSFQPTYIRAGHSWLSRNIYKHQNTHEVTKAKYNVQSFGPYPNSTYFQTNCKYLKIMSLETFEISNSSAQNIIHLPQNETNENDEQIQFFANPNFEDRLLESNATRSCSNIVNSDAQPFTKVNSIKTNKCVMVYLSKDCNGRSLQILEGGINNLTNAWEATVTGIETLSLLYAAIPDWTWTTKSFHICNENQLNVDITKFEQDLPATPSIVLESYNNVCSCRNVPKSVVLGLDQWSINNFENSMIAYLEQDCSTSKVPPLWIPAGRSSYSMGIGSFQHTDETGEIHKVQSFGPDPDSKHFLKNCAKLYGTITKFQILPNQDPQTFITEDEEITFFQTAFQNNGSAYLTQTYSNSQVISEVFEMDIGTSISYLHSIQVEEGFRIEIKRAQQNQSNQFNDSSPLVHQFKTSHFSDEYSTEPTENTETTISSSTINYNSLESSDASNVKTKLSSGEQEMLSNLSEENITKLNLITSNPYLKSAFEKAYQISDASANFYNESVIQRYTQVINVSQVITVPPCSEQVLQTHIKMLKINRTQYRALIKTSGKLGDQDMDAAALRRFIENKEFEYFGDYDNFTILVYASGNFNAVVGESYLVSVNERAIPQCLEQVAKCPECQSSNESDTSDNIPLCRVPDEILQQLYGDKLD